FVQAEDGIRGRNVTGVQTCALPISAWRLLEIWRGTRELAEEPLERALLCNAQVLAESCLRQGAPVFDDGAAVLAQLTAGEMEARSEERRVGNERRRDMCEWQWQAK